MPPPLLPELALVAPIQRMPLLLPEELLGGSGTIPPLLLPELALVAPIQMTPLLLPDSPSLSPASMSAGTGELHPAIPSRAPVWAPTTIRRRSLGGLGALLR
jgi:hypothetical protein